MEPIEALRVGDRVISDNPDVDSPRETQVDPKKWRLLNLRAETVWADGTVDDINVETLQPPEWIAAHNAKVSHVVPLPLDLIEMGLPEDLRAVVLTIGPCPPIRPGAGRLVLSTVNHLNNDVRELTVMDGKGNETTIRPTGLHKFYFVRDGAWVSAKDLQRGSIIRARGGQVTVLENSPVPGVHRVYNLTVEGEHVYEVSEAGILTHNVCWPRHHPFPKYLGGALDQTLRKMPRKLHDSFHGALDRWKGGKYSRSKGAGHFKGMDRQQIINDLREFYETAEGGIFRKYLPDFERAVRESGF